MIRTAAPGKVILLGEYAVLYGATALVAAVDRCARVSLETAPEFEINALGRRILARNAEALRRSDSRFGLVASVLDRVFGDGLLPPVSITIDSSDFFEGDTKLGLGSSAAVAVALARACREYRGETLSAEQLFRDAHEAHRLAQGGVGSGIDIAASAYGGVLAYRTPAEGESIPRRAEQLRWPGDLGWTVVFTGHSASTPELVAAVDALREHARDHADSLLARLSQCSEEGARAFQDGNLQAFFENVAGFSDGLVQLGEAAGTSIVSPAHQRRRSVAQRSGAVYKPSGAGGGDIGVAFWPANGEAPFQDSLSLDLYPATTER